MGDKKANVLKPGVDLGCGAGEQQNHTGHEYQYRQNRSGQARGHAQALPGMNQALSFVHQQQQAGNQQRQNHIDHAIQQQGGGQRRGTELVGKGGQQDGFKDPDTAGYVAEYAGSQCQQINQHEGAKRRCFGQQQIQHGGRSGDVQCSDHQLQEGQARARQA